MNRIDTLFQRKAQRVLSVYMTAGYPNLDDTLKVVAALDDSGVDLIEIGMPFSDPLADGEVIQESSQKALENGMSLKLLFEQLKDLRKTTSMPVILMGYLNPVLAFGFANFLEQAMITGIDGLILPDLPLDIYSSEYQKQVEDAGLHNIMLITPQTGEERVKEIVKCSGGFLYMVADSSTTGAKSKISDSQIAYFNRIKSMNLSLPRLIGFGISSHETFNLASDYANGAIIGSAFIKSLVSNEDQTIEERIKAFTRKIIHP